MPNIEILPLSHQFLELHQVDFVGAAPVVSDSPEQKAQLAVRVGGDPVQDFLLRPAAGRVVMGGDQRSHDLGTVETDPDEVLGGERTIAAAGPAEYVGIMARFGQDLDQSPAMSEGVEV